MMFLLFSVIAVALAQRGTDLCLPLTHTTFVATRRWSESESIYSHHYDEFREGDFMKFWSDGTTRQTLAHIYEAEYYDGHRETHHIFSLRNYQKKYHWTGNWNETSQSVTSCKLELFEKDHRQWGPYCVAKDAVIKGSGTVGKSIKTDFWGSHHSDPEGNFEEEIDVITEAGSVNVVLQERVFGTHFNRTSQKTWYWSEHREFFDFVTTPIASDVFTVPAGCPNP